MGVNARALGGPVAVATLDGVELLEDMLRIDSPSGSEAPLAQHVRAANGRFWPGGVCSTSHSPRLPSLLARPAICCRLPPRWRCCSRCSSKIVRGFSGWRL